MRVLKFKDSTRWDPYYKDETYFNKNKFTDIVWSDSIYNTVVNRETHENWRFAMQVENIFCNIIRENWRLRI